MGGGFELRFSGAGGQGLQLGAKILAGALAREGRMIAYSQSYEPTSRGGVSRSDLVVGGNGAVDYPLVSALDYLLILDQVAAEASDTLISSNTLVLADSQRVESPPRGEFDLRLLPFTERAIVLGSERVANMIALAALVGLSALCRRETLEQVVRADVPGKLLDLNLEAMREGFALSEGWPAG